MYYFDIFMGILMPNASIKPKRLYEQFDHVLTLKLYHITYYFFRSIAVADQKKSIYKTDKLLTLNQDDVIWFYTVALHDGMV
jgi:hypothetical protein